MRNLLLPVLLIIFLAPSASSPQEESYEEQADMPAGPCYDAKIFINYHQATFDWTAVESPATNKAKQQVLQKDTGGIKTYIDAKKQSGTYDPESFLKGMHLLDINGDKKLDIVFDTSELSWPVVYIYLNNGGSYTVVFNTQCCIKSINPKEKRIVVNTYTTGGYSLHNYELELVMYTSKAEILKARHFSEGTLFPRVFSASKKCTVGKKGALLALEPHIKGCYTGQMPGFFKYPEGATGHILATQKEKSDTWHFVLMDNTIGPKWVQENDQAEIDLYVPDEYLTKPGKKMKAAFYGWIKAESLTVE